MLTNPGFFSTVANPRLSIVTTEAFLGLTHQVQALARMMQTFIPYLPQFMQLVAPQQPAPLWTPQDERPQSPQPKEGPPDTQILRRPTTEGTSTSLDILVERSTSHSWDVVHTAPEPYVISSDSTDSIKEHIRQVNQRLEEVQREFVKLKEEFSKSSKGGSLFVLEIQGKPVPTNF
ncbi:hypothetical protein BHE74_00003151 [Ensete ventricosum]|nr:hypothetical protein GW17_00041793 [Ensete ventricosum]RWW87997.1 hypothetical protein BHE74_00003151 [Ensete ventricosum]